MTGQPTSKDVAAAAGVARSTVSYVLNETPGVQISDATKARVLSAAESLGYLGNAAAADLRRGGSRMVFAVIAEGRQGELMVNMLNLVTQQLRPAGYPLMVGIVDAEVRTADVRSWAALRPAVILCIGVGLSTEHQEVLRAAQIPVIGGVTITQPLDQAGFARSAARALLERGRRSLLHVLPADPVLGGLARPREAPFAAEVAAVAGATLWGTRQMAVTEAAAAELVDEVLAAP
ncbi:MAG: LacI family DNA-binding transcriptional regulator, partial [Actinomycetes bacterium]